MEATQQPPEKPGTKEPRIDPPQSPGSERWGLPRPLFSRPVKAVLGAAAVAGAGVLALVLRRKTDSSRDEV